MRDLDPRLHDYQVRAIEHLHTDVGDRGRGLFMDMGLGKTATVLQGLEPESLPALVVAPLRVANEVWEVERDIWRPDLSIRTLTNVGPTKAFPKAGDRREHLLRKQVDADITVISRDQVSVMGTRVHPYKTLVLDELSGYKGKTTARWKSTRDVLRVGKGTKAWGLTGTPAPNGYHDLYGQIYMLDRGKRLGRTLEDFRDRYFTPDIHPHLKIVVGWDLKPGAEAAINKLLEDLCLSMKARDYLKDLPGLHFNEVRVPLPPKAERAYRDLEQTLVADLSLLGGPGAVHSAVSAAHLTNRLMQVCAGFLYYDQDTSQHTRIHEESTRTLAEIQDGTGDNILTFYQFDEEGRFILDKIPGAVSIDEKGAVKAWNRGEIRMLVAHPASAGHGLNLQHGGSTQVWHSLPWSLEHWEQGVGRTHRQGQENDVIVHWLNPGPIASKVYAALQSKQRVQDALMDYLKERHLWL
jgi:SNF2 family DNA or RNA helicase